MAKDIKNYSRRKNGTFKEKGLGLRGTTDGFPGIEQTLKDFINDASRARIIDNFSNPSARTGFGTPNITEDTQYPLVRFTYNYWDLISLFEGHWLCRRIVEMPAQDMIRTWPKVISDCDPKDLNTVDRAIRKLGVKRDILTARIWANLFGGAGALMWIEGDDDKLDEPLKLDDIMPGTFKGLIPFDRWAGIQPHGEVSTEIDDPDHINLPEHYRVTVTGGDGYDVHSSRILRFCGPENPTPEREAYSWWGISELQPVMEEIRKYDNLNNNIINLSYRANLLGIKYPQLAQLLSGIGSPQGANAQWAQRLSELNHLISNQSLIPLPVDGGLEATQYSFAGISEVMLTQMLVICAASKLAFTRLWGRSYSGLGSGTNEGDEKVYEERIATENEIKQRPQLEKLYPVLFMSELGEIPDDYDLVFPSIRVLDEKEKSDLAKTTVDTLTVALGSNIISPRKYAQELKKSSEVTDLFTHLDDEFINALSDEVEQGLGEEDLFASEEGAPSLTPSSSPQKVLREENKGKKGDKPAKKPKAADSELLKSEAGTLMYHNMPITIETRQGEVRRGKGFTIVSPADYGFINGVEGADGDELDCYVGPSPESNKVFVVDQLTLDGQAFDEHKCMLGYHTQETALEDYMSGHHRSSKVFGGMTEMEMPAFRRWMATADLTQPCAVETMK